MSRRAAAAVLAAALLAGCGSYLPVLPLEDDEHLALCAGRVADGAGR